jgi:hypothetical protein
MSGKGWTKVWRGRFAPAGSDPAKEMMVDFITGDINADMDTIAECANIRKLIYQALQRLDRLQAEAVRRNKCREERIKNIRTFNSCTFNNYSEGGGK